jgi:hypothetical protein
MGEPAGGEEDTVHLMEVVACQKARTKLHRDFMRTSRRQPLASACAEPVSSEFEELQCRAPAAALDFSIAAVGH